VIGNAVAVDVATEVGESLVSLRAKHALTATAAVPQEALEAVESVPPQDVATPVSAMA
jgi:hypothetical protein